MSDLTDFLLARIAEDEAVAREAYADARREPVSLRPVDGASTAGALSVMENIARWYPGRVLAECEAKRRTAELLGDVIARFEADTGLAGPGVVQQILAEMAKPYADHPDYRPEWRP